MMETTEKNTLLIVDDENVNLKVLSHILGQEYTIYTATNGKNAIEKDKEYKPDLILLDILMPETDGYQTLSIIKNSEELKKIPVIFITGLDSDEDEKKGLTLEAADYITKPFSAHIVKLRVQMQIQLVKMHRDLEEAVNAAETTNRTQSIFLSKINHEIRTFLNSILGISEIQLQNEAHSHKTKDAFTKIYNSGNLLLGIINDVLDMSSIEAGKLELIPVQYDVASLITEAVFLNTVKFENKPVKFILNADKNVPSALLGDGVRIKQILNNLLSNAFEFTNAGEIELSVVSQLSPEKDSNYVTLVFTIRDTGIGMTKEQVARLFNEYSFLNPQTGRVAENIVMGNGLGISITRHLIQMMDGEILAESEPGKGSVFTVRLPQKITCKDVLGEETVEKMQNFNKNYKTNRKKDKFVHPPMPFGSVIIVDDDDFNIFVVEEMLTFYGLLVDKAKSGREAIEKIKHNTFDLVFMDHIMPEMDGIETTAGIRKLGSKYEKLPIIALTANTAPGVEEMFLANGFDGFLSKPVSMHKIYEVIKKWIPLEEKENEAGNVRKIKKRK